MYFAQRLRFQELNAELCTLFQDMALDYRGFPGVATEFQRPLHSSASTPSLRSRESELVPMARIGTPENGGGNVRVVVRVRGFLPRGIFARSDSIGGNKLMLLQRPNEALNVLWK